MKHALTIALAVAALAVVTPSVTAAVDVPLADLEGGYEVLSWLEPNFGYPDQRIMSLTLPANIAAIDGVSLVVSGEWHAGEIVCNVGGDIDETYPLLPELILYVTSDAFPGRYFLASLFEMPAGPFTDLALELESCCPPGSVDLAALIGAELQLVLTISATIVGICSFTLDTYGTLDDVHLEITGTVPTAGATWSGIKSLYE